MPKDFEIKNPRIQKQLDDQKDMLVAGFALDEYKAQLETAVESLTALPELIGKIDGLEKLMMRPMQVEAKSEAFDALPEVLQRLVSVERSIGKLVSDGVKTVPAAPKATPKMPSYLDVVTLTTTAEFLRRVNNENPVKVIEEFTGGSANKMLRAASLDFYKAATEPATSAGVGWASELTTSALRPMWFDVENTSVMAQLSLRGGVLEFGRDNQLFVPKWSDRKGLTPEWVQEGSTIPVVSGAMGYSMFARYKLGAIAAFSNELARTSRPNIRAVIEQGIVAELSDGVDGFLLDKEARVVGLRPSGLLFGANTQASAGSTLAHITTDLKWLIGQMITAKARDAVLLVHPLRVASLRMVTNDNGNFVLRDEVERGELFGLPLIVSHNVAEDEVVALDAAVFRSAIDAPEIDMNGSATLTMLNADGTEPTMSGVDEAGSVHVSDAATVTGGPAEVRSMFQTNGQAIRIIAPTTWGMMKDSVAYLSGVGW